MGVVTIAAGHTVDGITPRAVLRASADDDVVDAIRAANEKGEAIVVHGGRTRIGLGDPPARYDVALDLSGLRGVVEYEPDDMVATVRAGTTIAELVEAFSVRRQRWPVEPGLSDRATVGGTFASAAFGPSRLRYFHPRDWVIGGRFVLGDGTPVRAGGKVVKNVTGYDLTRLLSGTYGTLAVIVELTLKLTSLPERTVSLSAELDVDAAFAAAADLHATGLPFDGIAIATGESVGAVGGAGEAALLVRIAGPAAAVRRIGRAVRERVRCRDIDNAVWENVANLPLEGKWAARLAWPSAARPALGFAGYSALIYPASRVAYLLRSLDRATFRRIRASVEESGGALVIENAAAEYKQDVGGAWGTPRVPLTIARELKRRFDPRDVLAPGRVPS